MKVPPKRKGNLRWLVRACSANLTLNESPSEKEGKYERHSDMPPLRGTLNESPSEKEGKSQRMERERLEVEPLNESPSEKEGK